MPPALLPHDGGRGFFILCLEDDEAFADKMQKLTEQLGEQMAKGSELDALIRQKLGGLGYEF